MLHDLPGQALQQFARIDFGDDGVPEATTLLSLRRLRETQALWKGFFSSINANLTECGFLLCKGALGDATLIAAPAPPSRISRRNPIWRCTRRRKAINYIL